MSNSSRPHILLVDGNPLLLNVIARVLRLTRRPVLAVSTAEKAAMLLAEHDVGVIVCDPCDVRLAAFLIEARERYPSVVRVILTGSPNMGSVVKSVNETNPFKLLTKPWLDDELVATVKLAFAQHAVNRKRDRLIDEFASIRASAECSHASHVLDALMSVPPEMHGDAIGDLPIGVLLLKDDVVAQVNATAQRLFAAFGLPTLIVGASVADLPASLVSAALATRRRQRRSYRTSSGGRLDYFVLELAAGTLIAFAPAPKSWQPKY